MTTTHSDARTFIEPKPADPEVGSIDGFEVTCSCCSFVAGSSIRTQAEQYAHDHLRYMLQKEAQS